MATTRPEFTLTPQSRTAEGARVLFECLECRHVEMFVRLQYADVSHTLASDHYWGECPEVRWQGPEEPRHAANRATLAGRHRDLTGAERRGWTC